MTESSSVISYQVEYKNPAGAWVDTGPRFKRYADALDRLKHECDLDPSFTHRIVQRRLATTVMSLQEAV